MAPRLLDLDVRQGLEDRLERQLDDALETLGVGATHWNDAMEDRFIVWLHIHVLQDAVSVLADARSGKATKADMAEWLFSERFAPFSFRLITRLLGVDPGEFLDQVMAMPAVQRGLLHLRH